MAREAEHGGNDSSIAAILKDYVPRGEHEQILDALNAIDEENTTLKAQLARFDGFDPEKAGKRIAELEGKVRTRNYQDAWKGVADELGIDEDFRDDVFDSLRFPAEKDEPDVKALKAHAKDWLEAKDSRKKYLRPAAEGEGEGTPEGQGTTPQGRDRGTPPAKPRLHAEDDAGRGAPVAGGKMFRYRSENLSDHEWMRSNATEYAKAAAEGRLQKIG